MKYEELENLAKCGKLKVEKRPMGVIYREKGWRGQKWDDTTLASWDKTRIAYKRYFYSARTPDMREHQSYKITKRDFIELSKIINERKNRKKEMAEVGDSA